MNIKEKITQALRQRGALSTEEIIQEVGEKEKDVIATLRDLETAGEIVRGQEKDTWELK